MMITRPRRDSQRTLTKIFSPTRRDVCEFGDEDDCDEQPAYLLEAPGSYVKPMVMCESHAKAESVYYGTVIPA